MTGFSGNRRGALLMVGSMTGFTFNDAFIKLLSQNLPLFQVIALRGMLVVPFLALLCWRLGQLRFDLSRRDWGVVGLRTAAEIMSTYFFLQALFHLPLPTVSAILQTLPLTVSLGAALVFGDKLGWRRLLAIAIGFGGVMLIIRPGLEGFNAYSIYAIGAVLAVTARDLAARAIGLAVPSVLVAFIAACGVTVAALVMMIAAPRGAPWLAELGGWIAPQMVDLWWLAGAAICIIVGYICSVATMRVGEVSFVAPFRYTSLIVAIALGYAVFGDRLDALSLLGACIVVATGLFTLAREARIGRAAGRPFGRLR